MQVNFVVKVSPLYGIVTKREVTVLNIIHGADPVDSYIEKAEYTDTGILLTDDECNQLQDQIADLIDRDWHEHQIDKAEFYAEGTDR